MARRALFCGVALLFAAGCVAVPPRAPGSHPVCAAPVTGAPDETPIAPAGSADEAPAPLPPTLAVRVTLHHHNTELHAVLADLGAQAHLGFLVALGVRSRVSIDVEDVPWRTALERIALSVRADLLRLPGGTIVLERMRFPRLPARAQALPLRHVLDVLARRAGLTLILDGAVDGVWSSGVLADDPVAALEATIEQSRLHARRFGHVVVVAPRPIAAGDADLDADRSWRESLGDRKVTLDLSNATTDQIATAAHVAVTFAPASPVHATALAVLVKDAPVSDLVAFLGRLEKSPVHGGAAGLVIGSPSGQGSVIASGAPADKLLLLMADAVGKDVVSFPRIHGAITTVCRGVELEDALEGLAALEGLEVFSLGGDLCSFASVSARPLESLAPAPPPVRVGDGRSVELKLEATIARRHDETPDWALISGHALRRDDELVLPAAPQGERAHLGELAPNRCTLEVGSPSTPDSFVVLVLRP